MFAVSAPMLTNERKRDSTMTNTRDIVVAAIDARINAALAVKNDNLAKNLQREKKHADAIAFACDCAAANAQHIAITDKSDENHVAIYALQKIRKIGHALRSKSASAIDEYTKTLMRNLIVHSTLNNHLQRASLSRDIERDGEVKLIQKKRSVAVSTSDTQSSSSRQALSFLNVIDYDKEARTASLRENDIAASIVKLLK
jgi:hypothetical protein